MRSRGDVENARHENARHENVAKTCRRVKMQNWKMWHKLAGSGKCKNGKETRKV